MKSFIYLFLVLCYTFLSCSSSISHRNLKLISSDLVYSNGKHAAFTSLIGFNDTLFLSFREAPVHNPKNSYEYGRLKVIRLINGYSLDTLEFFCDTMDLRDPFFIEMDSCLRMYCFYTQRKQKGQKYFGTLFSDYINGKWSELNKVFLSTQVPYVLWKVRKMDKLYYSVGYNMNLGLVLFKSIDGINWEFDKRISLNGNYTEADLIKNNSMLYTVIRNEDSIGAPSLFINLQSDSIDFLTRSIASPELINIDDSTLLCAGREYDFVADKSRLDSINVSVLMLDRKGKILDRLLMPTNRLGDKGYPSFYQIGDTIFMSYYYGHSNNTKIYIAKIQISEN